MDYLVVPSGLVVGVAFGFVLQRGRFCLNTALRNALYIHEYTLLRSYALAFVVAAAGANLLDLGGALRLAAADTTLPWLACMAGGYVFGVGMVFAGGDAAGTWSRSGEGFAGSWMALLGVMVGAASARQGALSGLSARLTSISFSSSTAFTLPAVLGVNRWVAVGLLCAAGLLFAFSGRGAYSASQAGYPWKTSAVLTGAVIVLGLFVSERMTGVATGITFPGPTNDFFQSVVAAKRMNWGAAVVAGVPLGSFLSARGLREFSWRAPRAAVMAQQFGGGLLMGAGGIVAGGCSIGHGLSGMAALSLRSFLSMAFIALGALTMVYVLFMRGRPVK